MSDWLRKRNDEKSRTAAAAAAAKKKPKQQRVFQLYRSAQLSLTNTRKVKPKAIPMFFLHFFIM